MPKDDEGEKSSAALWVVGILVAVILYLLSPGPVFKLQDMGVISKSAATREALHVIYYPLGLGIQKFKSVEAFCQWWLRQFGVKG